MGRVRTKTVKRAARQLIEKYYYKLSLDFHMNKKILDDVSDVSTKRLRNKIAGFTTHLMKRLQKGPVRGVSLKIQEEQKELLLNQAPENSNIDLKRTTSVEKDVLKMLQDQGHSVLMENCLVEEREELEE